MTNRAFVPSAKKLYDVTTHQNSSEFKQLGTLAKENRTAEYYPPDQVTPYRTDQALQEAAFKTFNLADQVQPHGSIELTQNQRSVVHPVGNEMRQQVQR